ncbi:MAG: potassium-transporting ATPase subunit KdpB [Alphaproteobacteria bacterium]
MSASMKYNVNLGQAAKESILKLSPRAQFRNPVMFVVYIGSLIVTLIFLLEVFLGKQLTYDPPWFLGWIAAWLWGTLIFSNFSESVAEGQGKAQAESLRALRKDVVAKKLKQASRRDKYQTVSAASLHVDDIVLVEAGDFVPGDGRVIDGIASVDESAITGESAPVIRESDGDSDAVTGGTRVLSDWLVVQITSNPGETFIDKMVALVEGAKRKKTPNEVALSILLCCFTLLFLITIISVLPFSIYSTGESAGARPVSVVVLIALTVCLAPTTIGGLLSAIGIAGMDRLLKANVIALSGRAVEAAGDVNVLLLDKTGTITQGNRQAEVFYPAPGVSVNRLADAAQFSSLADNTPEGRSVVALAREKYGMPSHIAAPQGSAFIEFSAETRYSGIRIGERKILKGAPDAIQKHIKMDGKEFPQEVSEQVEIIARSGGTPMVVIDAGEVLGTISLKDIVKPGIKERLTELRRIGIRSVMITGDNPLTAAAVAAEAGVDDYLAEATPEAKLMLIRAMQARGELVAMVGDGTNDAPALAQSNVAVVMNSGTQAAKEAGNMVDLDSDPTKLIEIVIIGKQLLMTRGSLTTFSIANDLAKYFAILPAAFSTAYPAMEVLNIMHLASPASAMLSAVIFNALIIFALIPLALKGVAYRKVGAVELLRHNLFLYGIGGLIAPFFGIKIIDFLLVMMGLF